MKHIFFAMLASCAVYVCLAGSLQAQDIPEATLVVSDDFALSNDGGYELAAVANQNPSSPTIFGWADPWTVTHQFDMPIAFITEGLTSREFFEGSQIGTIETGCLELSQFGNDGITTAKREIDSSVFRGDEKELWISFLYSPNLFNTGTVEFISFISLKSDWRILFRRVQEGDPGGIVVTSADGTRPYTGDFTYNNGEPLMPNFMIGGGEQQTYHFLLHLAVDEDGKREVLKLWIDPLSATDPGEPRVVFAANFFSKGDKLDRFEMQSSGFNNGRIDEIKIFTVR